VEDDRPLGVLPADRLDLLADAERLRELLDQLAPESLFE
jgi:hypothetical protein